MRFAFAQVTAFAAKWKRMRLTDEDLQHLEAEISSNPEAGDLMKGTGGLRKLRFAPPSWRRGKSGSLRVCYIVFFAISTVYLLAVFAKAEKDNLSNEEKNGMRNWIGRMRELFD
jgi:hypothetical protein